MVKIPLCPHGMNQVSCPTCFRNKPPPDNKPKELPGIRAGIPMGQVMPIGEATMRATQRAAAAQAPPVVNGKAFVEPYRSSGPPAPEAFGNDKLWKAPKHKELMDRLPQHPHVTEGTAKVLKV